MKMGAENKLDVQIIPTEGVTGQLTARITLPEVTENISLGKPEDVMYTLDSLRSDRQGRRMLGYVPALIMLIDGVTRMLAAGTNNPEPLIIFKEFFNPLCEIGGGIFIAVFTRQWWRSQSSKIDQIRDRWVETMNQKIFNQDPDMPIPN